jgi:catechol 2,3-dioxygenase-like lactoylglutathione lyase family enzyme
MIETVLQTVPILTIFDVDKAREFYVGFLGFSVDWEHPFDERAPLYMQVSRGGLVLHLSEHHGDACPGSTVFVRMTGLADYPPRDHRQGLRLHASGNRARPWNADVMEVTDPFGNRLRFNEDVSKA